jgi:hypothetical protein
MTRDLALGHIDNRTTAAQNGWEPPHLLIVDVG